MGPDYFKVPKASDYWVDPSPNTKKGGSAFYYRYVFASVSQGGKYKVHCLPAGCHPFSPNEDNATISTHVGWNLFHQGWKKG